MDLMRVTSGAFCFCVGIVVPVITDPLSPLVWLNLPLATVNLTLGFVLLSGWRLH